MIGIKTMMETLRKEERLHSLLPVKVFLSEDDEYGSLACDCELSLNKVVMAHSEGIHAVNQTVWVERQNRKAKYRVSWIGHSGIHDGQIGLELMDSGTAPWDHRFSRNFA